MRPIVLIINFLTSIIEFLLGVRFFLKLIGAGPSSGFVKWIYENSQTFLEPFNDIFSDLVISNKFTLEFNTLIALLIYGLIAYLIILAVRQVATIAR
jgi:hypothetical protein